MSRGKSTRHADEESILDCVIHEALPRIVVFTAEARQADFTLDALFENVACSLEENMPTQKTKGFLLLLSWSAWWKAW